MGLPWVIFLLVYFSWRNSIRAKLKGKNIAIWIIATIVAFFVGLFVGEFVLLYYFCKGINNFQEMAKNQAYMNEVMQKFIVAFNSNLLFPATLFLFAIGGYLLIRYILEKMPEIKKENKTNISEIEPMN